MIEVVGELLRAILEMVFYWPHKGDPLVEAAQRERDARAFKSEGEQDDR